MTPTGLSLGRAWKLGAPRGASASATWTDDVRLERVTCPLISGHRRPGRRLTPLDVVLPDRTTDFMWTVYGEALIQRNVLEALRDSGITGFDVAHARGRFADDSLASVPDLWELLVTGWGGVARRESGILLDTSKSCSSCGHLVYTSVTNPNELIDTEAWDGSDVFMVWPLPRFIFTTDRVAQLIMSEEFTGVELTELSDLRVSSHELTPGRLSYWFSRQKAHQIGGPLGIE